MKEKEKKPVRKSSSEAIAEKRKAEEEARKKKQEELAKQNKEEEEAKKKAEALAQKSREEEAERLKLEEAAKQEEETRAREAELAKNNTKVETPIEQPVDLPPVVDGRHETFKRGGHSKELLKGDYIIAGVFSSEANGTRYTNGLKQLGYQANYGFLTQKQLWYVYIYKSDDINQAKAERDKYRKLRMFKDAWLLTIVE